MKHLILFISLFINSIVSAQTNYSVSEEALKNLYAQESLSGVSAAISINEDIKWQSSYGYANLDSKILFNESTLTRTASIAKPMTAVAVMQLFEKGLVDLEAPIQTYIKEFPVKNEGVITVRQLLNHSSGLDGYKSNESESKKEYQNLTEAMNIFIQRKLISKPGIEENYTSYGYVVLGVLIERVSHQSFEDYMKTNIWDKLEMNHTGIERQGVAYKNKALLYHRDKRGNLKDIKKPTNLSNRIPAGGFYTTTQDLLKFGQGVLQYKLISKETTDIMFSEQNVKFEGNPYALGWRLYGNPTSRKDIIGHEGGQQGVSAMLLLIPNRKMTVVVLSNTSGVLTEVIKTSLKLFEDGLNNDNKERKDSK